MTSVSTSLVLVSQIVLSLMLSWVAVAVVRKLASRLGMIDIPNERSSHHKPTPRGGGLGFGIIFLLMTTLAWWQEPAMLPPGTPAMLVGAVIVGTTGLADDRWNLPAPLRFSAYLVAAVVLGFGGGYLHELQWPDGPGIVLGQFGVPLTVLWVVALTNIYNFMDGIDGIAATQALVASATVGLLAVLQGDLGMATLGLVLASSVFGFLLHNWPPARIFMGDVGSALLGYTIASFAVLSESTSSTSFTIWLILLAPFLFDASLTLGIRITRGERWYEPHRQHLYQRLVQHGWSHLRVTLLYLSADLFLAAVAAASVLTGQGGAVLALAIFLPLAGILVMVKRSETGGSTVSQCNTSVRS